MVSNTNRCDVNVIASFLSEVGVSFPCWSRHVSSSENATAWHEYVCASISIWVQYGRVVHACREQPELHLSATVGGQSKQQHDKPTEMAVV